MEASRLGHLKTMNIELRKWNEAGSASHSDRSGGILFNPYHPEFCTLRFLYYGRNDRQRSGWNEIGASVGTIYG
jgi:hypothetical protein